MILGMEILMIRICWIWRLDVEDGPRFNCSVEVARQESTKCDHDAVDISSTGVHVSCAGISVLLLRLVCKS